MFDQRTYGWWLMDELHQYVILWFLIGFQPFHKHWVSIVTNAQGSLGLPQHSLGMPRSEKQRQMATVPFWILQLGSSVSPNQPATMMYDIEDLYHLGCPSSCTGQWSWGCTIKRSCHILMHTRDSSWCKGSMRWCKCLLLAACQAPLSNFQKPVRCW